MRIRLNDILYKVKDLQLSYQIIACRMQDLTNDIRDQFTQNFINFKYYF